MKDIASIHLIANCVAAFSFLTSGVLMTLAHVPHAPVWKRLRLCKLYLSMVFVVVGLSCGKTVFLNLAPKPEIVITSTLISAGIQSLLFACTGITFINPRWITRRWAFANFAIILGYSALLILGLCVWDNLFWTFAIIASFIYYILFASYQIIFYREYKSCVNKTNILTDEYSESRYARIKHFFIAVSILGLTAGFIPFTPTIVYDFWMIAAAGFYAYVVISFVNYYGRTSQLIYNIYKVKNTTIQPSATNTDNTTTPKQEDAFASTDFKQLELALQAWVDNHGFVRNDMISEEFAHSLGVSTTIFRSYFSQKYQMDFRQWRTQLRINYACTIIQEHPDYSYDTVAELVGISDRSNFTRTFKKITGLTPKEYAKKCV